MDRKLENQAQKWAGIPANVIVHDPGVVLVRTYPVDTRLLPPPLLGSTDPCHPWRKPCMLLVDFNPNRSMSGPEKWELAAAPDGKVRCWATPENKCLLFCST